jgi:hypothetical protein
MPAEAVRSHLVGPDLVESLFARGRLGKPLVLADLLGLTPLALLSIRPPVFTQTIDRNPRDCARNFSRN